MKPAPPIAGQMCIQSPIFSQERPEIEIWNDVCPTAEAERDKPRQPDA